MRKLGFLYFLLLLAPSVALADLWGNDKPDSGWWWYDTPPEAKAKPQKPQTSPTPAPNPEASAPTDAEKKPMSVAWMKKMIPILQERAIDNPSKENLQALFYLQRAMLDKSQRFEEEGKKLVDSDPLLDENNRFPTSSYGKNEFMNKQFKAREAALNYLASNVGGLFFFFDSKCDFCKAQMRILNYMKESYHFEIKYISMDGKGLPGIKDWVPDNGHAKLLNLKVYPTTVFVAPPDYFLIVSQGMMAKDELGDRILTAASQAKLLPSTMDTNVNPWDRGVLSVDDMKDGASDNPDEIVQYIHDKLIKRY